MLAKVVNATFSGSDVTFEGGFGVFATSGTPTRTLTVSNSVTFNGNNTSSSSGVNFTKDGIGTLTFGGDTNISGTTTIGSGTLQLGNGGTTGSLSASSNIVNNATLALNRSNSLTQGTHFGSISGTGAVQQLGTGTTTFTADNSYSGGTTVSAGTLALSGVGTTGSTSGAVTVNGTGTLNLGGLTRSVDL